MIDWLLSEKDIKEIQKTSLGSELDTGYSGYGITLKIAVRLTKTSFSTMLKTVKEKGCWGIAVC